jgi:hypothetical protein
LGQGNQGERVAFSQDKGLRPLLVHIQTLINDYVVQRIDPNFQFEFVGLNIGDEKSELEKIEKQVKTYKTINEIRAEHDLKPIGSADKIKDLGDVILDASWIQFVTGQQQAAQGADGQMGADGQPQMGADGQPEDPGQGSEDQPEPDYENMSVEELQAELDKLEGKDGGKGDMEQPKSPKADKKPPVAKSLELEL